MDYRQFNAKTRIIEIIILILINNQNSHYYNSIVKAPDLPKSAQAKSQEVTCGKDWHKSGSEVAQELKRCDIKPYQLQQYSFYINTYILYDIVFTSSLHERTLSILRRSRTKLIRVRRVLKLFMRIWYSSETYVVRMIRILD